MRRVIYLYTILLFVVLITFYFLSKNYFVIFHSFVELFLIVIMFLIFTIAYISYPTSKNNFLMFIGNSFFFVGVIELMHTLAYKGMNVFPGITANIPTQLWIFARYIEGISFAISPVFIRKNLKRWLIFLVYIIITAAGLFSIFYFKSFPDCYIEGIGLTSFKKMSEYIISSILILTIFLFYSVRKKLEKNIFELLIVSIVLSIIGEIFFTIYVSVYAFSNAMGHIFKALSFFLIYVIFIRTSIEQPYKVVLSAIEREKNAFKAYLENTAVMFLVLDRDGNVNLINKKGSEILGYSKEEVIGKNWFDNFIPEDTRREVKKVFDGVIAGNADLLEYYENPVLTKDGKQKIVAFRNSLLTDDVGEIVGTLSSGEDITERMLYEKKLNDLASKDDLTGVLNKRAGFDVLDHVRERSRTDKTPFTICFMDFDGLKFVNDNFGHDKGDAYIISVVNTLKEIIRDSDYIMRFGGDEFMLVLPKCTETQASEVIKRANKKIDIVNQSRIFPFRLGMSYGFSEFDPNNPLSIDELIKIADTKMYKMKKEHRSMENGSSS